MKLVTLPAHTLGTRKPEPSPTKGGETSITGKSAFPRGFSQEPVCHRTSPENPDPPTSTLQTTQRPYFVLNRQNLQTCSRQTLKHESSQHTCLPCPVFFIVVRHNSNRQHGCRELQIMNIEIPKPKQGTEPASALKGTARFLLAGFWMGAICVPATFCNLCSFKKCKRAVESD